MFHRQFKFDRLRNFFLSVSQHKPSVRAEGHFQFLRFCFSRLLICPCLYGFTTLWTLAAVSVSWFYSQSVNLLGRGSSPSQGQYLHIERYKRRINAHRHPCLEWDSNARLLWLTFYWSAQHKSVYELLVYVICPRNGFTRAFRAYLFPHLPSGN
jgi:hypothetical protein